MQIKITRLLNTNFLKILQICSQHLKSAQCKILLNTLVLLRRYCLSTSVSLFWDTRYKSTKKNLEGENTWNMEEKFVTWKKAIESKGLTVNVNKTTSMKIGAKSLRVSE